MPEPTADLRGRRGKEVESLTWRQKLAVWIIASPGVKTLVAVADAMLSGVLSGAFISEISTPIGLDWGSFYRKWSFYGLLILTVLTYFYHKTVYGCETDILRFADDEYCLAYMRSLCLPAAAERYNEMIRRGNFGELERAMAEVRRILE